jgi:thiol-disulfide isomerase/thioredoxin
MNNNAEQKCKTAKARKTPKSASVVRLLAANAAQLKFGVFCIPGVWNWGIAVGLRRFTCALLLAACSFAGFSAHAATYQTSQIVTNNFSFIARRSFTRPDGMSVPAGARVYLDDFAGRIVFFEWFAVWCPYCVAAAPQVEEGIADWYEARGGNPQGVPVLHVAVNQEANSFYQNATDNFINQHGFPIVFNDYEGNVINPVRFQFTAGGQPLFVAINCVTNSPSHLPRQVLVNYLGYGQTDFNQALAGFRAVIDAVQAPVPVPQLTEPRHVGADFEFTFSAQPGQNYRVQASTDLLNWTTLQTIPGTSTPIVFRDTNAPEVGRFYRVVVP